MPENLHTLQDYYNLAIAYSIKYGLQVLYGLLILFIGAKIGGWAAKMFTKACEKKHLDITLSHFLANVVRMIIILFAFLIALDKFGITVSPLVAAISAAIFGASFAIQAPLSNYASGLSIIFTRPFVVGNTITVNGFSGVVEEVKLPCTILATGSGEKITIPNKDIVGHVIINSMENKLVKTVIGISYAEDPERVIHLIQDVLRQFPEIRQTPAPQIGIASFGDSAINIDVRFWAPTTRLLPLLHDTNFALYKALKAAKVTLPFPQREIRILSQQ